jgi:hypothetical protein
MVDAGWYLVAAVIGIGYLAVVLANLDGAVRALRAKHLPAWLVGVVALALLSWLDGLLGAPLGAWGGWLVVVGGIGAGVAYRMRQQPRVMAQLED